jgi:hypothetical protein
VGTIGGTDLSELVTIDARTGAIRRLGPEDAVANAVSADGRTILYTTGFLSGSYRTGTIGLGGGGRRELLRGASVVSATADWSP